MAHDARRGIRRRAGAEGSWPGPRERRPTEAKHARRGGPTARPFCKSFLLEAAFAADGPRRQTPGGGLFLALAADVPAAFPAGAWRQRSETFIGHRAFRRATTFDARGPLALKTGSKQVAAYVRLSYIRVNLYV